MDNSLFRKEAMEEVTGPDELNQAIRITSQKIHLLVLGVVVFVLASVLWGFYGAVPVTIQGSGIIMPDGGVHYITSEQPGIIRSILVKPGQFVREGERIGSLEVADEKRDSKHIDIIARSDGRISEVRSLIGDFVDTKEKVMSIVAVSEGQDILKAIVFVSAEEGKNLKRGLNVHIHPTNVNKEEYGYIKGVIEQVSEYPVSRQRMLALLGSEALVSYFSDGQVVLEVEVDLTESDTTISGYQWSTLKGPPFKIYEGTLCYSEFIVEIKKPVQLVMPGF